MKKIRDVMIYLCKNYPKPEHLSKARLTKLVYLVDWKSSIQNGRQITQICWYFNHYGPYVADVPRIAERDPVFHIKATLTESNNNKDIISLNDHEDLELNLNEDERMLVDDIIKNTDDLEWKGFINLVYSTYPVITSGRFEYLNLPKLAEEYKKHPAVREDA